MWVLDDLLNLLTNLISECLCDVILWVSWIYIVICEVPGDCDGEFWHTVVVEECIIVSYCSDVSMILPRQLTIGGLP